MRSEQAFFPDFHGSVLLEGDDQLVDLCILVDAADVSGVLDDREILDALSIAPQHRKEKVIQLTDRWAPPSSARRRHPGYF